jgi:predicted Fe-Mo cluster-binding NifX family protein
LGFAIEDDDETVSLTEYAKKSIEREHPEENPLTVLGAACKACVPKRIHVTDLCQGCVARPCQSACKFGAIEIVNGKSTIDASKCKNCKMCIAACPYNAIVKVAVPCEGENINEHFGKCQNFRIYNIQKGELKDKEDVVLESTEPTVVAEFMKNNNVNTVVCGGINQGAMTELFSHNIVVIPGMKGNVDVAVSTCLDQMATK